MIKALKSIANELVTIRKLLEVYVENDQKYVEGMIQPENDIEITDENIGNYIL